MGDVRRATVAGSWYPASAAALTAAVDECLEAVGEGALQHLPVIGIVAPHAGLRYSGPVAAHAYRQLRGLTFDVAVLVGPAHFEAFEGVAAHLGTGFDTPLGLVPIDLDCASALVATASVVEARPAAHQQEHSLEMQLPFLQRVAPGLPIVPLLMGRQTAETARALADGLMHVLAGRRALLVASTDLSHYHDATTALRLDSVVLDCVSRLDPDNLDAALRAFPHHACGGGPLSAVMRAAGRLGASRAAVLKYGDSGDVSGDKASVVGYVAAVFGGGGHVEE